jgi:2-keto-4-pentenoate hydratase/2-oxohepta-3-ene-1,7-dioic acid hydratase in catechol pathway
MRHLSQFMFMALKPSRLINTGTPERVVCGRDDRQHYLRLGEVVRCCNGLSRQRRRLVQA